MSRIKILSETLIGKIAAGEVVERPASVVKELIENSIDAYAKSISVFIKEYGIAAIKVIDDGEGISNNDVILAFQRHATSKLNDERDLFSINTLGFRGEALYSIAQVSKLRIVTQHKEENTGTELYLVGGRVIERKPVSTKGTIIEVNDLFFNTPVRRNFLKSPYTEKSNIIETVQNYCLAYPEISFSLIIDEQEVLHTPTTDSLTERIAQLFGIEFIEKLKTETIEKDGYRIQLFLGSDELLRRQRTNQIIFVNRRPVRDSSIVSTIYKALQIKETHPQFFIFINLSPEDVDFNVHPAKKEVKFRTPHKIHQLIFRIIKPDVNPLFVGETITEWEKEQISTFETESIFNKDEVFQFLNIGNAILALSQADGMVFLDYHAAHERINFEKILNRMENQTIKLVFPHVIQLNPLDYEIIIENLPLLNELGIEAEDFGKNSIIIRAIPEILKDADIAGIIENIVATFKEETVKPDFVDIKSKIAATVACHSSLRSNDEIGYLEIKTLLKELAKTSDPEHCPHGRPIKKFISFEEIKRWFKR